MAIRKLITRPIFPVLCALTISIVIFQNCGKVSFSADRPSDESFFKSSSMMINNGAQFTNSVGVKVQVQSSVATDVYLTNDPTCGGGGSWQPIIPEIPWNLAQKNGPAKVYARFRTVAGAILPCVDAGIVHDDQPPVVAITQGPGSFTRNVVESLALTGQDTVSGIDHYECRKTGDAAFSRCDVNPGVSGVDSGPVAFQARAVDRAGNISIPIERFWVVDHVAPIVAIVSGPSNPSAQSFASFQLQVTDEMSGVDHVSCRLDGGAANDTCPLIVSYPFLADGNHSFEVSATDKAGNQSASVKYDWLVKTPLSGDFQVIGITSSPGTGTDQQIDNVLATSLTPQIYWSVSKQAVKYRVSVLDSTNGNTVCAEQEVDASMNSYAYTAANCTLKDGGSYQAKVVSYNLGGTPKAAELYLFTVDATPPMIVVKGPFTSDDQKTTRFDFTITDASGIQDATCKRSHNGVDQTFSCKDLTTYTFNNLPSGDHYFSITATDKVGNVGTSTPVPFKIKLIVCDPLTPTSDGTCKKGLQGNLFYLTGDQIKKPFSDVNDYVTYGQQADAIIYLSQVYIPTRSFEDGFGTSDHTYVTDNSGQKLTEWFALDLQTVVKLGPNDSPGLYQLGVISDDGAVVSIKDTPGSDYRTYLDNNGYNSSLFKCDQVGMQLDANSRIPVRLRYFQGPRTQIALVLAWRKVDSKKPNFADPECDQSGNDHFFGPNYDNFTTAGWGNLVKTGWKQLAPENFILQTPQ